MVHFDRDPFAVYGTHITLNYCVGEEWNVMGNSREDGIYLQSENSFTIGGSVGRFALIKDGVEITYEGSIVPGKMTLEAPDALVEATYDGENTLRFRGKGCSLEFQLFFKFLDMPCILQYDKDHICVSSNAERTQLVLSAISGALTIPDYQSPTWVGQSKRSVFIGGNGNASDNDWEWELAVESYIGTWLQKTEYVRSFDECVSYWKESFDRFYEGFSGISNKYSEAVHEAVYLLWSGCVSAAGYIKRDQIYMSRRRMRNFWSWDHCMNAISLADVHPNLAWDQMCIPFDLQDEQGRLPDSMNDHDVVWVYTKPPIHGAALLEMIRKGSVSEEQIKWLYPRLSKWTEYWTTYADWDRNGLCQYENGNTSGWDNCTYFSIDGPFESPELNGYIALQMEALSVMADMQGLQEEAVSWKSKSEQMVQRIVDHFWDGERLYVHQTVTGKEAEGADSLLPFLTLYLGHRLPDDVFRKLSDSLFEEGRFVTPYGLASEGMKSPFFGDNSYWRGSIWPITVYMVVVGLLDGGDAERAKQLAESLVSVMAREGFAENFSPIDGRGLCDHAYTWSASVFLEFVRIFEL